MSWYALVLLAVGSWCVGIVLGLILAVAVLDLVGFGLIGLGQAGWACLVFGAAAGLLLGLLLAHWRDL